MGRKLTQDEFEKKVKQAAPNLTIKGKYINNRSKIDVKCMICGYTWDPKAQSIMDNKNESRIYCPSCNRVQQKTLRDLKMLINSITDSIELIDCKLNNDDLITNKDYFHVFNKQCKHDWTTQYNRIQRQGIGCPYCANKKVLKDFNDIATTAPWMCELLKNKEDAYKYTKCSGKKLDWLCKCGKLIENRTPNDVYHYGLTCSNCSDGISYPERVVSNVLTELKIKYKTQYIISDYTYKYDFYLIDYNYIIEVHGNQHYDEHSFGLFYEEARTLEEELENDIRKKDLAISLGYKYIVLDCRKSELDYIKESILNSEMSKLFNNINNLDWNKIHINSLKSKLIYICELYNNNYSIDELCTINGISHNVCINYLRKGNASGLCNYSGFDIKIKALEENHENIKKPIRCVTTGEFFDSITSAVNKYGFSMSLLSGHLNGRRRRAGVEPITGQDMIWEFV